MQRWCWLWLVATACGKHTAVSASAGSGSGTRSGSGSESGSGSGSETGSSSGSGSGSTAKPEVMIRGVLAIDDSARARDPVLAIAFDHAVPRLPAIRSDGTKVANLETDAGQDTASVKPWRVVFSPVNAKTDAELAVIVDDELVTHARAGHEDWAAKLPAKDVLDRVVERGQAIARRLHDETYVSLVPVETAVSEDGDVTAHVGQLVMSVTDHERDPRPRPVLEIELAEAGGKIVQNAKVLGHTGAERADQPGHRCQYRPTFRAAFVDPATTRLVAHVELVPASAGCASSPDRWVALKLPPTSPAPSKTL